MKKMARFFPVYTVLAGVVCAFFRKDLLSKADAFGLLPNGHPAHIVLLVLPLMAVAMMVAYLLAGPKTDYRMNVSFPVQALGFLAAGAGYLYLYLTAPSEMMLLNVLTIVAAVSFFALAFYRVQAKKPPLLFFALVSLAMMVLCFYEFRAWGRFTQLQQYLFPALATLFPALYSLEACYMELPERNCRKSYVLNQLALLCTLSCLTAKNWPFYASLSVWLVSGLFTRPNAMKLPGDVLTLMEMLEKRGYSVYAVGGCVRDSVLGRRPHDYDLCTDATPEQMHGVFSGYDLVTSGEKHGTVGVVLDGKVYEITTYRTEGGYEDNRHPDSVEFVKDVKEDLARRDFTVNAMAYHPKKGYVDPFGGQKDLSSGVLRAVGDPETRFREDALRILRGVRFACRFRLEPEAETLKVMEELAPLLHNISRERIYSELTQTLCRMEAENLQKYAPQFLQVIPQLKDMVGFQQKNPHHAYDVFTHTAHVLAAVEPDPVMRWAALLHDVGKPQTYTEDENGVGHFYGHAKVSAQMADEILRGLKASNALREDVVMLILHHMDELSEDPGVLRPKLSKFGEENLKRLVKLKKADAMGCGCKGKYDQFDMILAAVEKLQKEEGRLQIKDLDINGHDLMELGYEAGPKMGQCQQYLLEAVLAGEIPNEKEPLSQKAKEFLEM